MVGLFVFAFVQLSRFPVDYRSNNSSSRRDIVGTIVLAILFGKDRYVQINAIPRHLWPYLLRGDVGYGSGGIMSEAEARGLLYLFKIKRTGLAKELFAFLSKDNGWTDCGCGWEGREHRIRLSTWKLARRCIFIRRPNVPKPAAIPLERARWLCGNTEILYCRI